MPSFLKEHLLELPLFQGISRYDLVDILKSLKPQRMTSIKGRVIVREGDTCNRMFFLLNGSLNAVAESDDHEYTLTEELKAPNLIQPECIFGLNQRFTRTFKAAEPCELMVIAKPDIIWLSDNYNIFKINLLNIICTRIQKTSRFPWRIGSLTIRQKIARFVEERCLTQMGKKTLTITMPRLAQEIGESRLNVSHELRAMKRDGLIQTRRSEIHFPTFESLIK